MNGHSSVIKVLCGFGADANIPGKDGTAPLHLAAQNEWSQLCNQGSVWFWR